MDFTPGPIEGVIIRDLKKHKDHRGWLMELFRTDEIPHEFAPAMAYVSSTEPGITRGPHEHANQADFFCFIGPSAFKVYLWDNRRSSKTFRHRQVVEAGEFSPKVFIIPAGVVHAYKNAGSTTGWVINLPNRLYAGQNRGSKPDEIRHEDNPKTEFILD